MTKQRLTIEPKRIAANKLTIVIGKAQLHAVTCKKCLSPIVKDNEGNPGYRSEACPEGVQLLDEWDTLEKELFKRD